LSIRNERKVTVNAQFPSLHILQAQEWWYTFKRTCAQTFCQPISVHYKHTTYV